MKLPTGGRACLVLAGAAALLAARAYGQPVEPPPLAEVSQQIEVTATRLPEDVESVPAAMTIISGQDLRATGASDLASALALVAGVSIAPGGDGGPAAAVPELWGLREFDAFLLVVDGVPWGGAFNPDLTTLDLNDIDRIEVLRGAAPVMYGATSFVGVIHVIHAGAAARTGTASLSLGNHDSGDAHLATPLPALGAWDQSLSLSAQQQGFADPRMQFKRGQLRYRGEATTDAGSFRLDLHGTVLRQRPGSPSPRDGAELSPLVPIDSNQNPTGSKLDQDRLTLALGYDRQLTSGGWSTTLSYTRNDASVARGFLVDLSDTDPNANGFRQELGFDDLYFDTHLALKLSSVVTLVAGVDELYGRADERSEDFDYYAALDGSVVPDQSELPAQGRLTLGDTRSFAGLYAQLEWSPTSRWQLEGGARLNHTHESLHTSSVELVSGDGSATSDSRTVTRGSGSVGANFLAWRRSASAVWVWADYRNTFKPAALDFGPDAEGEILAPETSRSYEIGLKGRNGLLEWNLGAFRMDLENLVVSQLTAEGLPGLVNAGSQRFKGIELDADARLLTDLRWRLSYAYHDARFVDYVRLFDDVPTQLAGKAVEMSARNLASTGLLYSPSQGVNGTITIEWVGERYLNMRNTALAPAYTTWSAGLGYRLKSYEVRLDSYNLDDTRPPISESELGDAQYYRLPARSVRLTVLMSW
jgi:iron complex outermembrane recepter protein